MKKEDAIHILTAMKKSYLSLGIPDPEAVGALDMAIKAIQADNREKVYQKAFEDIRVEIEDGLNAGVDIISNTKKGVYPQIYSDDQMEGRKITYEHCLKIISKHNPDKVENEGKE